MADKNSIKTTDENIELGIEELDTVSGGQSPAKKNRGNYSSASNKGEKNNKKS